MESRRIERLRRGDWQFGHQGRHNGVGTEECPRELHHHHDEFCDSPTDVELRAAGIEPEDFRARSRADHRSNFGR
jgi:hypothetical protein